MTSKNREQLSVALDAYQTALAMEGDQRALNLLYKRWHPKLLRFAQRQTGDPDSAQDVMQEASLAIAKSIHKLKDPESFGPWAFTIVRRRAADHLKRLVKDRQLTADLSDHSHTVPNEEDENFALSQALDQLSESDRLLLKLFYLDGLSGAEMAAAMGIPLGTVKSRLFTARAALRDIFESTPQEQSNERI